MSDKENDFKKKIEQAFALQPERLEPYTTSDSVPISISEPSIKISERFKKIGFVVLDMNDSKELNDLAPRDLFLKLGERFGLGPLYVPVQYTHEEIQKLYRDKINKIASGDVKQHSNFYSTSNQKVHTDGTLDPFNTVRTAMLYCKRPAEQGGENTVFNVIGALSDLYKKDISLAEALFRKDSLTKFSPSNPSLEPVTDRAMSFDEKGRIITRYSDSEEFCRWSNDSNVPKALQFMRKRLVDHAEPKRNAEFKLLSGQVLVLANNQVAHSRKRFVFDGERPREMWRALYTKNLV